MADNTEDPMKQAQRILEEAQRRQAREAAGPARVKASAPTDSGSTLGNIVDEITSAQRTKAGTKRIYTNIKNIFRKIAASWPVRLPTKAYKAMWRATDAKKRKNKFTRTHARFWRGILCLWTASTVAQGAGVVVPDSLGGKVVDNVAEKLSYFTFEPVYDSVRMLHYGVNKEQVCLNKYTEIDHAKGEYSASGSPRNQIASAENSLYYLVKPSWMHNLWHWSQGHLSFFDPNRVGGAIANGDSRAYEVVSYGARWRVGGIAQASPELLHVARVPSEDQSCSFNSAAVLKALPQPPTRKEAEAEWNRARDADEAKVIENFKKLKEDENLKKLKEDIKSVLTP